MTEVDHRTYYRAEGDEISIRETEDGEGTFEIRMPIASTGTVRNEGDDPLTRDELDGMREQVGNTDTGVFPEHGASKRIDPASYSQFERLGDWEDGDIEERSGEDLLFATARMPDPETLPAATGSYRESLAILKEQAKRNIGINSSIGWREDDAFPGDVDLMEVSIVGIGADPRTNTGDDAAELMAHAAVEAGADPDDLVARVRNAVDAMRPLGPPEDPDRFDDFEECVNALQEDEDLSREEAERICGSWEQAKDQASDNDMTDDTDPDEGTDDEQDEQPADTNAPEDIGPADFAELVASHYDGLDAADVTDALDEAGGDFVGEVDLPELASFVADVVDEETGTVQDAFDDWMGGDGEENETDEDDEEEGDDEQDAEEPDEAQDAEEDEDDLRAAIDDLKDELVSIRENTIDRQDVDVPDADDSDEQPDDDTDPDTARHELESWNID